MKLKGIRIYWEYKNRSVMCYIITDEERIQLITNKSANCSSKDIYSKEKGRRISLDKALRSSRMHSYLISDGVHSEEERRKFRAEIWEAYRTMTKEPRWKLKTFKK